MKYLETILKLESLNKRYNRITLQLKSLQSNLNRISFACVPGIEDILSQEDLSKILAATEIVKDLTAEANKKMCEVEIELDQLCSSVMGRGISIT